MQQQATQDSVWSPFGAGRVPIVLVSSSSIDAWYFRQIAENRQWLIVNVPDIAGARLTIERLRPALVVCDTEIEGPGSWRDLLEMCSAMDGAALIVMSRNANEGLRAEVVKGGGTDVLAKPFVPHEVERAVSTAIQQRGN